MNAKVSSGGCLCGAIRFEARGVPKWTGFCHCESCRRATGGSVASHVGFTDTDLSFVEGAPKIYTSSPGVRRGFCAECGSSLTYESDRFPDYIQVYVGAFDEPDRFSPQAHVHCKEQISWFNIVDDLPRYAGSAVDE